MTGLILSLASKRRAWRRRLSRSAVLLACATSLCASAQSGNSAYDELVQRVLGKFAGSLLQPRPQASIRILPERAPVGVLRSIVMSVTQPTACRGDFVGAAQTLDTSTINSGVIKIGTGPATRYSYCPGTPTIIGAASFPVISTYYEITPTTVGTLKVQYADPLGSLIEATMITTAVGTATPRYDINGMWYDPASDGSGISMHQTPVAGVGTLGTWFMFDKNGVTRWYSLQASSWIAADTLEGLFIEAIASCGKGAACPAPAIVLTPTFNFRMVFQSATSATAEVFGEGGALLFKSELRRLQL